MINIKNIVVYFGSHVRGVSFGTNCVNEDVGRAASGVQVGNNYELGTF